MCFQDNTSCEHTFNLFSEHTRLNGRSNLDQGTIQNVHQNSSCQEQVLDSAMDPIANYNGVGLNHVTNVGDNTQMLYNNCVFKQVELGNFGVQCQSDNTDKYHDIHCVAGKHFMVHFTNWQYIQQQTGKLNYIVYVDGLIDHVNNTNFYYLSFDCENRATLFRCDNIPEGMLTIVYSDWCFITQSIVNTGTDDIDICSETIVDPQVAFENYQKDCVVQKYFHMSYEKYMECIIDAIIEKQEVQHCSFTEKCIKDKVHQTNSRCTSTVTNPVLTTTNSSERELSSSNMGEPLNYYTEHGATGRDIYLPEKQLGHLTLQTDRFEFIGPDRQVTAVDDIDQYLHIAEIIKGTGKPNYKAARIPVKSDLNLEAWEDCLRDYPDKRLFQYLKFGFPLSMKEPNELSNTQVVNHYSALQYPEQVLQYLNKEREWGAILGPFDHPPTDHFHCSPLLSRPKDGSDRRIILNLSYPQGRSVNGQVDRDLFDGSKFALKLPTIDNIVSAIKEVGQEAVIAKIDVARAFRNLRVDPADALKFGIKWDNKYFLDRGIAFGWVHGTSAFQMVSDAVTYIMAKRQHRVLAYIDDYIIISSPDTATKAFDELSQLLRDLGLPINQKKVSSPGRALTCLGIFVDLDRNTLSIDEAKLQSILSECQKFATKKHTTKKGFQSLLGKLIYVQKCVKPARIFINRMLNLLRTNSHRNRIHLDQEFFRDLNWFLKFLPGFNGVTCIGKETIPEDHTLHVDASLTGLGGVWANRVYASPIIQLTQFDLKIVHLEMLNILVALRVWKNFWRHSIVRIFCDNKAVVQVAESGKTKDPYLAACIRNIWLITATYDIDLVIEHIQGTQNIIADCLSRLYSHKPTNLNLLQNLKNNFMWEKVHTEDLNLDLSI